MTRATEWRECKDDRDWVTVAKRKGYEVRSGKGSHTCLEVNGRSIPVPKGETRKGTKSSILRSLAAAGAMVFAGFLVFTMLATVA
jgi:hypothetical protein